jgi:3-oxoacyl-[acyl-carrier-protein] synthase II
MPDDVVITGMGIVSAVGIGEHEFWESLLIGRSAASPLDALDTTDLPRKIACQIHGRIGAENNGRGRASNLAVTAAQQAVEAAELRGGALGEARVATIIGTTMGETDFIEERLGAEPGDWLNRDHAKRIGLGKPGCIAKNIRQDLALTGPAYDLYGACAAGNMAVADARRRLLNHECDIALAGGADGFSRLAFVGFMRSRVMAAEVCRPFDVKRDGLLVGEGGVVFVLERAAQAKLRGAPIRATVRGSAFTSEDYHPTRPHPEGDGLSRATVHALRDAGCSAGDVQYVCAHGTGTPHNDAIEVKVMQQCFPGGVAFSSIKALTGHPMGAAAALEAAACILMLAHDTIIPTWHLETVLSPCELDAVKSAPRKARLDCVVNNSAGFGGYNASIVLTR